MTLAPGTRLGPYQVVDALGAGGMGEVYRAADTALKRDVAIKVLPELFAGHVDRLARFQREAELLAALNHPNVAQIYGLESAGGALAIVMELVEGPTLADRIARGRIPPDEALPIAMQIASALEAAHEQGIVHRDLKPANIKLRSDGTVKVLDFGIAKALEQPFVASGTTLLALATPSATQTGVVLGTPTYMSPEQARGQPVDERADIWAFGCVLYEMLTGQPPFVGDDVASMLARVLECGADMDSLPTGLSPAIHQTLVLCLQKDSQKRIADIRDVKLALEGAFASGAAAPAAQGIGNGRRVGAGAAWLGVGAVLGAMLAVAAFQWFPSAPPAEMRLLVTTPPTAVPLQFALSPDGRYLAFVASDQGEQRLWLRSLDQEQAQPIGGTEDARYPFWSPDARSIGFFTSGALFRVSVSGGAPQRLATATYGMGGAWNADGTILFSYAASFPLSSVAASGGTPSQVTRLDEGQAGHRFPQFLPDGRRFLFFAAGESEKSGVYIGSLDGGEPRRLSPADSAAAFLAPDWVLIAQQGSLIARRLDLVNETLADDPVLLAEGVAAEATGLAGFAASSAGHVAYRAGDSQRSQLTWRDRAGMVLDIVGEADAYGLAFPELSPDGRRVVAQRALEGNWDLWWLDVNRGSWARLTTAPGNEQLPVWSPDGAQIAFSSNRTGRNNLYLMNANGGAERPILDTPNPKQPQSWSTDGRYLLYYEVDAVSGRDLWWLDLASKEKQIYASGRSEERAGQFSPDGRWVAYETNATGRYEVIVQSFPSPTTTWPVSARGGTQPRWSADGREIYFLAPDQTLMTAPVLAVPGAALVLEVGTPSALFPAKITGDAQAEVVRAQYAVSSDGRFLLNEFVVGPADVPITLILNWGGG